MLKHVYIDNFRCLVNFELELGPQQLLLGLNGTGKSTLLEVLRALKRFITSQAPPDALFPERSRTFWVDRTRQTFELQVELDTSFRFRLELDAWGALSKIKREVVLCDERPLFEFVDGNVSLFNDEFEHKFTYPFDQFRSALATIQPRSDNKKLTKFLGWIKKLHCLRLNPYAMSSRTESEDPEPAPDMSNFASWYRYMKQERGDADSQLKSHLRQIIPDLESLDLRFTGNTLRILQARFGTMAGDPPAPIGVAFEELSDGQRVLICLYAVLDFLVEDGASLFIDEPENYIALPEVQPWLMELRDRIDDRGGQVILISHHPELIDYLAPEIGLTFERPGPGPGPVRVRKYVPEPGQSLAPSEQIARGWSSSE
ncbi:MAG: ATP-binding protein [Bryobacteraceae bacterium]|jgi:energy-coupling factor transporter ATP-binding protein EcfA2